MIPHDKPAFALLMQSTADMYGKRPFSLRVLEMYWNALQHFSLDTVRYGLNLHVRNSDSGMFLPKPADIIRHIEGNSVSQAKLAWTVVNKAIRHHGAWESVTFADKRIHVVIDDMGGWIKLCATTDREYPFKQLEFEQRYQRTVQTEPQEYPSVLIGIAQAQNEAQGLPIAPPVIIGMVSANNAKIGPNCDSSGNKQIEQKTGDGNLTKKTT